MAFKPRLTRPEAGNKYYITRNSGGWSYAIKGSPTDKDNDVLHNCVGYAYGRFHEIAGDNTMTMFSPVNAEKIFGNAKQNGLKTGTEPKIGALIVWQKGATLNPEDGAGHVAVVEEIKPNGDIVTSESGYNSAKAFWTTTRSKGDGNWGGGTGYKFLGFVYQPGDVNMETTTTFNSYTVALEVGDTIYKIDGDAVKDNGEITIKTKYTIVEEKTISGVKYGKLKSGAGWVVLGVSDIPTGTLKRGDKGNDVKWLQKKLVAKGYMKDCCVDSDFGNVTFGAVLAFQKDNNLSTDGICGEKTKTALSS